MSEGARDFPRLIDRLGAAAMRDATWVVYEAPFKDMDGPTRAVCAAHEWAKLQSERPGVLTLVEAGIASEGQAERLARGSAGDPPPRKGSPAAKATAAEERRICLAPGTLPAYYPPSPQPSRTAARTPHPPRTAMTDPETPDAVMPPPAADDVTQDDYTLEVLQLVRTAAGPAVALPMSFATDAAMCYVLEVPAMDAAAKLLTEYAATATGRGPAGAA